MILDLNCLEKYKGIPYLQHGRDFDGLDCWGLPFLMYSTELGIHLPSWSHLYTSARCVKIEDIKATDAATPWKEIDTPAIGDLALFQCGGGFHVGICVDEKGCRVLHITEGNQVTIEDVRTSNWKRRFRGYYHYVG